MVAVITGASSGIGAETARALARRRPGSEIVLVARREDRLRELAAELDASYVPADLTDDDAPARVRDHLAERHGGALHLLVNNAGASWRATFADGGHANVRRHMELNFDAQLRLTEALLPLLRASAPSAIVNVASVAGRVARGGAGAYSASKFALIGWSDALHQEERPHGVHVGLVLPGFVRTEGFPAAELTARRATRWLVSTDGRAAGAILDAGLGGRAERYVPRPWAVLPVVRAVAPGLLRRLGGGSLGRVAVTKTGRD
ncbi:MAG TPA: SDR family NAD(P)-dependent oxidoreductase [Solirubrobacteraceae bacterium]|jgi:short-subunit dehydrogenase|nr:SDR family NAD(P)-dependent oxidoreductase [Solirubrobacteraceae bacterium]